MKQQEVETLAASFCESDPGQILRWAVAEFSPHLVMSTAFGVGGIVLLHFLEQMGCKIPVFYIDTGLLFPEVHQLRSVLEDRFGITFERITPAIGLREQAEQFGENLWERDPDTCCLLRKVVPLREYLRNKRAWITAIRAGQTEIRSRAKVVEWDERNQIIKINPLLKWTEEQVWSYIREHKLPYNPLHDRGYPSLGCTPCTLPIEAGEGLRAGRWKGHSKVECGIHLLSDVDFYR